MSENCTYFSYSLKFLLFWFDSGIILLDKIYYLVTGSVFRPDIRKKSGKNF